MNASPPAFEEQVPAPVLAFLKRTNSYPDRSEQVEVVETHMSWVFLLDRHVYKLKKPVRRPFLDFRSRSARRRFCFEEVRLNHALAPGVYLGAVPLVASATGLRIGGDGSPIDWLVRMRRLPADRMLDQVIRECGPEPAELSGLADRLVRFYRSAPSRPISPAAYRRRLRDEIAANQRDLTDLRWAVEPGLVRQLCRDQLRFVVSEGAVLDRRVDSGAIIEGHGDLRPEHICLIHDPVIIDRLEFEPRYRHLDPIDELSYLAMECDRLGNAAVGRCLLSTYCRRTGDRVPERLIRFYKSLRACQRARLAVLHLQHRDEGRSQWLARARSYLSVAAKCRQPYRPALRRPQPYLQTALRARCGPSGAPAQTPVRGERCAEPLERSSQL